MRLKEILTDVEVISFFGDAEQEVKKLVYDSREAVEKSVFFAISGHKADGHNFIETAIQRGARVIVYERETERVQGISYLRVNDCRLVMARMAGNFYLCPSSRLMMIGVTGTDGKTTTCRIIHAILSKYGQAGLMGTVGHFIAGKEIKTSRTTPESLEINQYLADLSAAGGYAAVMEVSSHAIALQRTAFLDFDIAVFTNLSQDHLDFHQNMDDYFDTKAKLFANMKSEGSAVVNLDDEYGKKLREIDNCEVIGYSLKDKFAPVYGEVICEGLAGIRMNVYYENELIDLYSPMFGRPNSYNILAAAAAGLRANCGIAGIKAAIADFRGVKGRFERIDCGKFAAVIDYAHTPKAVENAGAVLRKAAQGKLTIVLGCGGDRDKSKRPAMAAAAEAAADKVILTSDNPRSEDPRAILQDMTQGLKQPGKAEIIPDRKIAIRFALDKAGEGDITGIFGKGHEDYQEIKGVKHHFDDREVVEEWVKERLVAGSW